MSIYVAFPGNESFPGRADDVRTFGGAPCFLLKGLNENGHKAIGLDLSAPRGHKLNRYRWNLKEALLGRGIGGYQYSHHYRNQVWRNELPQLHSGIIINLFQLFHAGLFDMPNIRKVFYIDQTLVQLFREYPAAGHVSRIHRAAAIAEEGRQYQRADLVICMCQWAADSVVHDYDISEDRVAVVRPGGSIDNTLAEAAGAVRTENSVKKFDAARPLRAVFVGMEPRRKGLFRFLDALKAMSADHERVRLTVIGPDMQNISPEYRAIPGVEWLGRIDKGKEFQRFVDVVRSHDIGILLSTAEATGLSLREFQMLGLGVLAPNVGGSPEMVAPGAGILIEKRQGPNEIAAIVRTLLDDPSVVARMKDAAWNARQDMTWDASAKNLLMQLVQRGIA